MSDLEKAAQQEPVAWPHKWGCRANAFGECNMGCTRPQAREPNQKPWCPDVCPITGLPFFMWIEHYETGQRVPTYGGPYDSYTIPVRDRDGSYCRERYDHDRGGWLTDEVEDVGVQIVSDQAFVYDDERPQAREPLTQREVELIDGMIEVQLHHAAQCDRIANRAMADKQKGWDMERVELLRKLKTAHGIKGDA